jgi:hypothetical protein
MTTLDTWCFARRPDGTRARGRLVVRGDEVLLLTIAPNRGVQLERWGYGGSVDLRAKTVETDVGPLRWQASCTCGQPLKLKGTLEMVLQAASA